MKKTIGTVPLAIVAALALAGPAHATRYAHFKTPVAAYNAVYQRDEKAHVEITWGMEGKLTNSYTNKAGDLVHTKTYPTTVSGDVAKALFVRYAPFKNHPNQFAWALDSKKWCTPAPTDADPSAMACSPDAPA